MSCKFFPFYFVFPKFSTHTLRCHVIILAYYAYNMMPTLKDSCFFFLFVGSRLGSDGQDFFTSYDEVFESFDAMGLQENLLRGIYAYGMSDLALFSFFLFFINSDFPSWCILMRKYIEPVYVPYLWVSL
jgi:hypothetical protein